MVSSARSARACLSWATAVPIARIRSASLNGLVRKSTAPCRMARTEEGISPCPVMKTIGGFPCRDLPLQIQSVDVRQLDVENEACRQVRLVRVDICSGG